MFLAPEMENGPTGTIFLAPATQTRGSRTLLAASGQDRRVLVHPGHFFDFASGCYLVVSLLCEIEVLDAALPALMAAASA